MWEVGRNWMRDFRDLDEDVKADSRMCRVKKHGPLVCVSSPATAVIRLGGV